MSTKHLKQFSYVINPQDINHGGFAIVDIEAHPFEHPTELVSVVNQGGKVKVHAVVDINQPKKIHKIAVVGTGATIPNDVIDGLYKIGQLLIQDGQFGYAFYLISELRGVAANGSDAGLKPVFSVKVKVDNSNQDDFDALIEYVEDFCAEHPTVARIHLDNIDSGLLEVFCYNNEFRHKPEFSGLMSYFYTALAVDGVNVTKSI